MRIATYNVNGINGRLANLLEWLAEAAPDIVCLLRIDHLLLSPAIARRLVAAEVDRGVRGRERASDHAPVWIELAQAKSRSSRRGRLSGEIDTRATPLSSETGLFGKRVES
jgi:hypothetical protein